MSHTLRRCLLLTFVLAAVSGCEEIEEANVDDKIDGDLMVMGVAYRHFQVERSAPPANWDELFAFAEYNGFDLEALQRVRDAGYTVTWNLDVAGDDGSSLTVVAQPPGAGPRLMGDGSVNDPR